MIALAGYAIYNLPIYIWALILLLISIVPFFIAIRRKTGRGIFLGASIVGVVVGSAYLFRGEGWAPAVSIWLVIIVSVLMGGFLWLTITKALEAFEATPSHNIEGLVGLTGEAKTAIHEEGSAQIAGELWSVRSTKPIPAGGHIRVLKRSGFVLDVEAVEE